MMSMHATAGKGSGGCCAHWQEAIWSWHHGTQRQARRAQRGSDARGHLGVMRSSWAGLEDACSIKECFTALVDMLGPSIVALRHQFCGGDNERSDNRRQRVGAHTQAPNGGSLGSVTMGNDQGSLAKLLVMARPWNRTGGNGAARAGERGVHGGEFFPTPIDRPA
jgi:hypothetical protein